VEITQNPIYAVFTPVQQGGFLYENEKEEAERHFSFKGLTQHTDEATPSDPIYRLSVYDTDEAAEKDGWDAETRELVESELERKAQSAPQNILIVHTTPIETPFPNYDSYSGDVDELVVKLVEDGHDLAQVLHYERHFGKKRPEVIDALEEGVETWAAVTIKA
jgi:hypothetical protein